MKFQDLEENYEENLLKSVYGDDYKLQGKLNNLNIARRCRFEQVTYRSDLGGAFALKLIEIPDDEKSEVGDLLNHLVLSIHLVIKEIEGKKFLFFGKKIERVIIIYVRVNRGFFKEDEHSKGDLKYCVEKFKPAIEAESGMKVSAFVYDYERD